MEVSRRVTRMGCCEGEREGPDCDTLKAVQGLQWR